MDYGMLAIGGVIALGAIIVAVTFALLIPLDSAQAVGGVTIITAVTYSICVAAWIIAMVYYLKAANPEQARQNMMWLLFHMMFLIVLPATLSATAMNVTTVQNTRNILAGQA